MKKFLSLALATAMGMSGASLAMADAATVDPSTLEPYNIVWYTLGTTASAEDTVMAEINKQMTEKFNATLTMNKNNNNDHLEKLKLLVAARESFDLTFISNDYANFVAQEAFYPLTDLLNEYGQDIMATYPQALWDCVTINGEIYAVPTHKYSCSYFYYCISKTQSDAAGVSTDWIADDSLDKMGKWNAFLNWCKEMKAAGADVNGYVTSINEGGFEALYPCEYMTGSASDPGAVVLGDDSISGQEKNVVFNQFATQEFADYCKQAREMFLAGITPKDETTTVELAKGDPAISTQDSMAKRLKGYEEQYSQDFLEYRPNYAFTTTQKIYGSMNAISDTSDDPERTMMFLNEMIGNTDFANLIFYGVEGVSYERNENGQIKRDTDAWNMTTWSLPGFITAAPETSLPDNMVEMYEAFDKELVYADNMGFAFDEEPVMTELAAIRQVTNEYYRALTAGRADPETELPKFLDALNNAGLETVLAEEQSQLNAWRAAQGK